MRCLRHGDATANVLLIGSCGRRQSQPGDIHKSTLCDVELTVLNPVFLARYRTWGAAAGCCGNIATPPVIFLIVRGESIMILGAPTEGKYGSNQFVQQTGRCVWKPKPFDGAWIASAPA
jgi:hypothetical protein